MDGISYKSNISDATGNSSVQSYWARDMPSKLGGWKVIPPSDLTRSSSSESESSEDQDLCSACRKIDFKAIFQLDSRDLQLLGTEVCTFTGLTLFMLKSHCPMCRAFASLVDSTFDSRVTVYPASGKILALPSSSISGADPSSKSSIACGISLDTDSVSWDAVSRCVSNLRGILLPLQKNITTAYDFCHGIPLNPFVDFTRVREMLSCCAKTHPKCQQPTHSFPIQARAIDCQTRRLVPLNKRARYLALSYVWGTKKRSMINSPMDDFQNTSCLPEKLPRTIEDAITATKALGLRYLWVDRYCIEQYHSADKQHQLGQMSNIYNRALATLCALGSHDDYGLPGVSEERFSLPLANTQGMTISICATPIPLHSQVADSPWSTRGWTFQEALLSRRCIFFTEQQVYVACHSSCQYECIIQATQLPGMTLWGTTANIFSTILDREIRWSTNDRITFNDHAQHYQQRQFTIETDSLPAFKSFLSVAGNMSYYGVIAFGNTWYEECLHLTARDYHIGFVHGLRWEIRRNLHRGPNLHLSIPSWSWLSRKHTLPHFAALHADESVARDATGLTCVGTFGKEPRYLPTIHLPRDDGTLIAVGDYLKQHQNFRAAPELSQYLIVTSIFCRMTFIPDFISPSRNSITFHLDLDYEFRGLMIRDESKIKTPKEGTGEHFAILLLAEPSHGSLIWLVLEPIPDDEGAYRRIALLDLNSSSSVMYAPTRDRVIGILERNEGNETTIRLR